MHVLGIQAADFLCRPERHVDQLEDYKQWLPSVLLSYNRKPHNRFLDVNGDMQFESAITVNPNALKILCLWGGPAPACV